MATCVTPLEVLHFEGTQIQDLNVIALASALQSGSLVGRKLCVRTHGYRKKPLDAITDKAAFALVEAIRNGHQNVRRLEELYVYAKGFTTAGSVALVEAVAGHCPALKRFILKREMDFWNWKDEREIREYMGKRSSVMDYWSQDYDSPDYWHYKDGRCKGTIEWYHTKFWD